MKLNRIILSIMACAGILSCAQKEVLPEVKPVIKGEVKNVNLTYAAGTETLAVEQTEGFDIVLDPADNGWLTAEAVANGVTLNYSENEGALRSVKVILEKKDVMWIFTVSQDASPTSGPHDIDLPVTKAGEMYGMIIYTIEAADAAKIPVGDYLVFDFEKDAGNCTITDAANEVLATAAVSGKQFVCAWTDEMKTASAGGLKVRINDLTNPVVKAHYTNRKPDEPVVISIDVPEPTVVASYHLVMYTFEAGAFAAVEPGQDVVFHFATNDGPFTFTAADNSTLATGAIENNQYTLTWTEALAAQDAAGFRARISNEENRIESITVTTDPAPKDLDIDIPEPTVISSYNMTMYQFDASAFDAVEEGQTVIFEFETTDGNFTLTTADNATTLATGPTTAAIEVEWTSDIIAAAASGLRARINNTTNTIKRIYVPAAAGGSEPSAPELEIPAASKVESYHLTMYTFPANHFAAVKVGQTVTFEFSEDGATFTVTGADNSTITSGAVENRKFELAWTSDLAEKDAAGLRARINNLTSEITKISYR